MYLFILKYIVGALNHKSMIMTMYSNSGRYPSQVPTYEDGERPHYRYHETATMNRRYAPVG